MPTFVVTAPNGKKLRITAPEGATEQDAIAYAKQQMGDVPRETQPDQAQVGASTGKSREQLQSELDAYNQQEGSLSGRASRFALGTGAEWLRNFGRMGKNVAQGGLALPAMAFDTPAAAFNVGADLVGSDRRLPMAFSNSVASIGGEQLAPRGGMERIQDRAVQGMAGALTGAGAAGTLAGSAGSVASRVGLSAASQPFTQAVAGATGGASAGIAQEAGAGPLGQIAAGMLGGMAGSMAAGKVPQPQILDTENLSPAAQVAMARDLGYKLPPKNAGGKVGAVAEGLSNSAKLERGISKSNQERTNQLTREAIGIGGKGPIPPQALDQLRKQSSKVYEAISKTGRITADQDYAREMFAVGNRTAKMAADFPDSVSPAIEKLRNSYLSAEFDASSAVQSVRQLRADASKYLKSFDDPEKVALGMASRQIADALDGQLQRHVEAAGNGALANAYRNARVKLAKIHSVEDALNAESGNVSAVQLGRMLDKGAPLSGNLLKIAQTARRFPKAVQNTEAMPNAGMEFADPALGAGGAGIAAASGVNPLVGVPLMLARPAARQVLQSDAYQNFLGPGGQDFRRLLMRAGATGAASGADKGKR